MEGVESMNQVVAEDLAYIYAKLQDKEKAKFDNCSIVITGCAGFLGFYLMHFLNMFSRELGIRRIIGLDNFQLRKPEWLTHLAESSKNIEIHEFNVVKDHIDSIRGTASANFVIHMASIASPSFYRKYPLETLDANVWGLRHLLDFYKTIKIKGFLFLSSSEIYGDPPADRIPTSEDYRGNVSSIGPRACYDEAKRFGETLCYLFAKQYQIPITIARPFNNYGPGMDLEDKRVPADFAKAVVENRDIEMYSDGTPTRTFCYIADATMGYLKVLTHSEFECFNIGTDSPEISIRDLAGIYQKTAHQLFSYSGTTRFAVPPEQDYLTHNPNRRCPDITKAKNLLKYEPTIDVGTGVRRFLTFLYTSRRIQQ